MIRVGQSVRRQTARRIDVRTISLALSIALLGACNVLPVEPIERVRSLDLLPRSPTQVGQERPSTGYGVRPSVVFGVGRAAGRVGSAAIDRRRRRLRSEFRKHAGRVGRQGHSRRYSRRRLHHRCARAGHGNARVRPAGFEVGYRFRAGERAAAERRRAGPRQHRLSPHAAGRRRRRGRIRRRRSRRAGPWRLGRAAAIRVGPDGPQAGRQLRNQGRDGASRSRSQPRPDPGQRERAPERRQRRAQFRCRLDARSIGRRLPGAKQRARAGHFRDWKRSWIPARAD